MHFFIRDKKPNLDGLSPAERKVATDAWDKAQGMDLRDAARERRRLLQQIRIFDYAGRPDLVRKAVEASRATRKSMERRINEL